MKFIFLFLLLSTAAHAQSSYVPVTTLLKQGGNQINFLADYFSTSKAVDKDGERTSLSEGQSFTRFQGEFGGLYGVTNELQLSVGARYRKNEAKFTDTNDVEYSDSSSGIQSTYLGGSFAFPKVERWQFALEGQFRYTPYTNETHTLANPGALVLGDDGNEYYGGLGVTYASIGNNFLTLRSGYRRPGKDLSSEIYWQAEGVMAWKYIALIAGVDGVTSMGNDPYEGDPNGRPTQNTGGSSLYNSTNRAWVTPYAGLNLALGKLWRIEFKGSQVVSGTSTDLGTGFSINLVRRADKPATKLADSSFKAYDIEASVTKVSPKKEYVVIDKGLTSDVAKGMRFDFFENDYVGGNVLVARGTAIQVKADSAIVRITQRYNLKKDLKEGLLGRATVE
jgi:hypothetical protein